MTATWAAILVMAAVCYALKLAGVSVPERVLDSPASEPWPCCSRWPCSPGSPRSRRSPTAVGWSSTPAPPGWPRPRSRCCCGRRSSSSCSCGGGRRPGSGARGRLTCRAAGSSGPSGSPDRSTTPTSRPSGCAPTDPARSGVLATFVIGTSRCSPASPGSSPCWPSPCRGPASSTCSITCVVAGSLAVFGSRLLSSGVWVNDFGVRILGLVRNETWPGDSVADVRRVHGPRGCSGSPVRRSGDTVWIVLVDGTDRETPLSDVGPDFLARAEAYDMAAGAVERWFEETKEPSLTAGPGAQRPSRDSMPTVSPGRCRPRARRAAPRA